MFADGGKTSILRETKPLTEFCSLTPLCRKIRVKTGQSLGGQQQDEAMPTSIFPYRVSFLMHGNRLAHMFLSTGKDGLNFPSAATGENTETREKRIQRPHKCKNLCLPSAN